MARLSWLATILAHYVLPRPPVWITLAVLGLTGAAAALVLEPVGSDGAGDDVVAAYTVNLGPPSVAIPEQPAVEQPAPEPPRPETELAKATPQPEAPSTITGSPAKACWSNGNSDAGPPP